MRFLPVVLRALIALAVLGALGCSPSSAKKEYVLAERLWTDGKYVAAVTEFDKAYASDPHGKLGLQALFRAATTQAFFLSQYSDAIRKYKTYAELSDDKEAAREARLQIGEILFSKLELYDQAAEHYETLLRAAQKPSGPGSDDPEAPLFLFREAKAKFFLWKFDQAIQNYRELIKTYPSSAWAERAAYEIGVTEYTRGAGPSSYKAATEDFEAFIKDYPKSAWVPQAQFGIASCLEEMDQLDAAYDAYAALKSTYPSPNVIQVKLIRLRERKAQRSH